MRTFSDLAGREWRVSVNSWTLKGVYDNTNVLLTKLVEDNCRILSELYADPLLLVSVLWWIVASQAEEAGVSQQEFAESLAGDPLGEARNALIEETTDFFDDPATRDRVRRLIAKVMEIADKTSTQAGKRIENLDSDLMARGIIDSFSSLPESAESNRGPTP